MRHPYNQDCYFLAYARYTYSYSLGLVVQLGLDRVLLVVELPRALSLPLGGHGATQSAT